MVRACQTNVESLSHIIYNLPLFVEVTHTQNGSNTLQRSKVEKVIQTPHRKEIFEIRFTLCSFFFYLSTCAVTPYTKPSTKQFHFGIL